MPSGYVIETVFRTFNNLYSYKNTVFTDTSLF